VISEIEEALDSKIFDKKISAALNSIPTRLVVEGNNPVRLTYDWFSIAVHRLPDDEALKVALRASRSFEYMVETMAEDRRKREEFLAEVKALGPPR
jgi:hypothetical protein